MNGGHLLLLIIVYLVISLIRDNNKYNADGNRLSGTGHSTTTRDELVDKFRRQSNYAAAMRAQQRAEDGWTNCNPLKKGRKQ